MQTCFIVITILGAILVILLLALLAFCNAFLKPDEDDCDYEEYKQGIRMGWLLIVIILIAIAIMWTWEYWLPNAFGYYKELLMKLF